MKAIILSADQRRLETSLNIKNEIQSARQMKMSNSMNDVHTLLSALEKGVNFAYAHFNDGELRATSCWRGEVDHGWQKCSPKLQFAMTQALANTSSSFFYGIPCFCEFPTEYWRALDLLGLTATNVRRTRRISCAAYAPNITASNQSDLGAFERASRMTVATLLINGNYQYTIREMTRIFVKVQDQRRIHVIMGDAVKNYTKLPFKVQSAYFTPRKHAFDSLYDKMRTSLFINEMGYRRYCNC